MDLLHDAFDIPEPKFIPRLPRAPPLHKGAKFVYGETVSTTKIITTTRNEALARSKLLCINDMQPFKGDPFEIPLLFDDQLEVFLVDSDKCCSPECAVRHVIGNRKFNPNLVLPLITQYAFDVFNLEGPFEPSLAKSALATQKCTLEEFRAKSHTNLLNLKPWMVSRALVTTVSQALSTIPKKDQDEEGEDDGPHTCACDLHKFKNEPFKIPMKHNDKLNKFTFGEECCSARCAARFVIDSRHLNAHLMMPLIFQRAGKPVAPAPPLGLLSNGLILLREWRSGKDAGGRRNLVSEKPSMLALHGATTATCERGHRNASVAALASAGLFYKESSGELLPQAEDICDAIETTIKDRTNVHHDTQANGQGLVPVGPPVPRRAMGMTIVHAPRARPEVGVVEAPIFAKDGKIKGLDMFLTQK